MIKNFIKKLVLREKASSEKFIEYLRNQGVSIGNNVCFHSPSNTLIDISCPWILTIGNNVNITHGVIILTHDYSWSVLKERKETKGRILGAQSPVKIGNNVFIGMNAIITRGVTVGDNVIIGAGSVVTKDCESNCVYAGSPAKKIMTIDEYYEKREKKQFEEAKKLACCYKDTFGKNPPMDVFFEYFQLFYTAEQASKNDKFRFQMETGNSYNETVAYMNSHKPMFNSYDEFLAACYE